MLHDDKFPMQVSVRKETENTVAETAGVTGPAYRGKNIYMYHNLPKFFLQRNEKPILHFFWKKVHYVSPYECHWAN